MSTIVVSNRVSPPQGRAALPGGLAVVMREALWKNGGIWFGWSGTVSDSAATAPPSRLVQGPLTYITVDLTRAEYEKYYLGFSNATLWPTLHYRLGLVEFDGGQYEEYLRVNARLARLLAPIIGAEDTVWVHDYHLIPMGAALRRLGIGNRIGFFLHTPFPAPQVFSALPRHDELLRAMAAYDLVGFQTEESRTAFLESIVRLAAGEASEDGRFLAYGRRSRAGVFPVGIDAEAFACTAAQSSEAESTSELSRLADSLRGRSLILGVDRLDYSKGIAQRFGAIEQLLECNPAYRRRFQYLQVTPCSREEVPQYRTLRRQLEGAAGRINGKFAECDWTPIRYVNKGFSRQTLAGFYRLARVGLVTPLRDGMNLVAKEFVAAQPPDDPGVLVLSRFAGAAHELREALLVNPIDTGDIAAALDRALTMPLAERQRRWEPMMALLGARTIENWRDAFLGALVNTGECIVPHPYVRRAMR